MPNYSTNTRRLAKMQEHLNLNLNETQRLVKYTPPQDNRKIGLIEINAPPVNSLSFDMVAQLNESFAAAIKDSNCSGIVISGGPGKFVGGAELKELQKIQQMKNEIKRQGLINDFLRRMTVAFNAMEDSSKPIVAAIDGYCLGGGLELAMACCARVSTKTAKMGLVELKLGIIPGVGGTQRLPRLVGIEKAVPMILKSTTIGGIEAQKIGLVDTVVSNYEDLIPSSINVCAEIVSGKKPARKSIELEDKIGNRDDAERIIGQAKAKLSKQVPPHVTYMDGVLDAILYGVVNGGRSGLLKEEEVFLKIVFEPAALSQVHLFFAQRTSSKVPFDSKPSGRKLKVGAVVGGGLMGSGIATCMLMAGMKVYLKEINQKFLDAGVSRIKKNFSSLLKKGKMSQSKYDTVMNTLLNPVLAYESFSDVDIVIEAVIEKMELKKMIFKDLSKHCPSHALLCTNTSTLNLSEIGESLTPSERKRLIGTHFFSPANIMPMLEIVRHDEVSEVTILDILSFAKTIRKTPIVVGNTPGFALNRAYYPLFQMATYLVDKYKVDPYHLDKVMQDLGTPMGVFRLSDLVGLDVLNFVDHSFVQAFPDRSYSSPLLELLTSSGRLGQKSGSGYYTYPDSRKAVKDNANLDKILNQSRAKSGGQTGPCELTDKDIQDAVMLSVVNEACRIMEEGHVYRASDIDIGSVMGYGFPSFAGGLIFWAEHEKGGAVGVVSRLEELYKKLGNTPLLDPCIYLKQHAELNQPLEKMDIQIK